MCHFSSFSVVDRCCCGCSLVCCFNESPRRRLWANNIPTTQSNFQIATDWNFQFVFLFYNKPRLLLQVVVSFRCAAITHENVLFARSCENLSFRMLSDAEKTTARETEKKKIDTLFNWIIIYRREKYVRGWKLECFPSSVVAAWCFWIFNFPFFSLFHPPEHSLLFSTVAISRINRIVLN